MAIAHLKIMHARLPSELDLITSTNGISYFFKYFLKVLNISACRYNLIYFRMDFFIRSLLFLLEDGRRFVLFYSEYSKNYFIVTLVKDYFIILK